MAIPAVLDKDHVRGPKNAPITLVEYGDFECPHCGRAYTYLKELQEELGDKLRLVYRHYPVAEYHPHAEMAAEASEAAGAQGKFWEMHDKLFEHQNALETDYLIKYAKELDLDVPKAREELREHVYRKKVDADAESGEENGVEATPTFFINGQIYEGPNTKESLRAAIQQYLR